jgi:hypothetical protein
MSMSARLKVELQRVRAARIRTQAAADDIARQWREVGTCCPDCFSRGQWSALLERVDRQDVIIKNLARKVRVMAPVEIPVRTGILKGLLSWLLS